MVIFWPFDWDDERLLAFLGLKPDSGLDLAEVDEDEEDEEADEDDEDEEDEEGVKSIEHPFVLMLVKSELPVLRQESILWLCKMGDRDKSVEGGGEDESRPLRGESDDEDDFAPPLPPPPVLIMYLLTSGLIIHQELFPELSF